MARYCNLSYTFTKANNFTYSLTRNALISYTYFLNSNAPFIIYNRRLSSNIGVRNPLFDKILIANRGEIACRVMQTAKKLGIKTVAVYSEADRHALHADEAYLIGSAPSADSYLNINKIISVAKLSNSQAIHPGYGFLSENPVFADLLAKENITFIGPPASAMVSMGSKSESKDIMISSNVPVVPGYHGKNQNPQFLKQKASEIGYPVLIKAIKGGGGKGMRIVNSPSEFNIQLESSKSESMKSFGDDQVLIEKYLLTPRHVEVQIFADKQGNVVHLFERDCSVQRRHQKILEEAPAPGLDDKIREELGVKAVAAAKAVNYVGAGTVEFIMDNVDKKFYFMEMNTRLQVEHPVTEMVTSTDLVQWQLEVASGNPLPVTQNQLKLEGHALEARIYAENPANDFFPDIGPLLHLRTPYPSSNVRIETGFEQGDEISVHYDPMIAKLIVKGKDRLEALRILKNALTEYEVVGLHTNIEFLKSVVSHNAFINGEVETGFITKHSDTLFALKKETPSHVIIQASLFMILSELQNTIKETTESFDPFSPWVSLRHARLNTDHVQTIIFRDHKNDDINVKVKFNYDNSYDVTIIRGASHLIVKRVFGSLNEVEQQIIVEVENHRIKSRVVLDKNSYQVIIFDNEEGKMVLEIPEFTQLKTKTADATGFIRTPMPCKISQVLVKPGQIVEKGTPLIVLEAMKMEHLVKSPFSGTIDKIFYHVGEFAKENKDLIHI
ncbi:5518_t:CDS:10 [Funneliformis geosporum]|uniref:5518_t:CDS:1 n=1 Tax=Funneliformis geosporum TaxID=1117311 RepID=A0A9W4SV07_9GLOM|nr:5518_t:CDS:10 [Funneliformis geosporum]